MRRRAGHQESSPPTASATSHGRRSRSCGSASITRRCASCAGCQERRAGSIGTLGTDHLAHLPPVAPTPQLRTDPTWRAGQSAIRRATRDLRRGTQFRADGERVFGGRTRRRLCTAARAGLLSGYAGWTGTRNSARRAGRSPRHHTRAGRSPARAPVAPARPRFLKG
jgi:hypothetical protein